MWNMWWVKRIKYGTNKVLISPFCYKCAMGVKKEKGLRVYQEMRDSTKLVISTEETYLNSSPSKSPMMVDKCLEEECIFFRRESYKNWIGSCHAGFEHKPIPIDGKVSCTLAKTKEQHRKDARQFMVQELTH